MKRKSFLLTLLVLGIGLFAYKADDDAFDALIKKLEAYNQLAPQEKVHLHLDKPYYAVGDNIWFKAYVINTLTAKPSDISTSLYVELINEKDSVKTQLKLPVVSGFTWGDFKLPDTLSEGNYRIRAYTQWMRNKGAEFFFDKTIKVGNLWSNEVSTTTNYTFSKQNTVQKVDAVVKFTDKNGTPYVQRNVTYEVQLNAKNLAKGKTVTNEQGEANISFSNSQTAVNPSCKIIATITLADNKKIVKEIPVKATSNAVDVQFFPESGNLVQNLPNKLGIKAINASGLGEDIEGSIIDEDGLEVIKFNTTHLGMGNFLLNPQPGKTYTARVKFKDGSENTYNLPKVLTSGYTIAATSTAEEIIVKAFLSEDLIGKGELKLVAQNNSNIYFISKSAAKKQVITTIIPKKDLPSGIIQFTLFAPDNAPVCERLVFVSNAADKINLTVKPAQNEYGKKENVVFNLNASFGDKPVAGGFSVAVTNTASVQPDEENESNIFTTLLLTSDISGYVEKPNYYFLKEDDKTKEDLDNLLLTQGWRRVLWKNVISNVAPLLTFPAEKSLAISGSITSYGGKPLLNSKVSLFSSSGGFFMIDTITDAKGRFIFDKLIFNDSTKFIVQARTAKNKKHVDINLDLVPKQLVTKNKNAADVEVNINDALSPYLKQSENYFNDLVRRGLLERTITLKEVSIVEKKNPAKNSANLNGAGHADAIITADQLQNCSTLSQCLQGRVAGLMIKNGVPYLLRNGNTPMQIIVDGMTVEGDFLDNITPMDVESIEVLKSVGNTAMYGSRGGGGVLIITTKRGEGGYVSTFTPGIITFSPKGYYIPKEFYMPKYDAATSNNGPDLRTTIYWNPQVVTDASGKAAFNYFNADVPGKYRVVVEGMDMDGNIARSVYTYLVK